MCVVLIPMRFEHADLPTKLGSSPKGCCFCPTQRRCCSWYVVRPSNLALVRRKFSRGGSYRRISGRVFLAVNSCE